MREVIVKLDDITYQEFHDTVDEFCSKGISKGCFQDYGILAQVVACLSQIEYALKESENK